MPGKSPKTKGNGFERELVNLAHDSGLEAKRAYASNGEALGHHAEVDLVVEGVRIQAKRRASIAGYVQPTEHVDAVALRQDHGEALIVLRYADWLDLVKPPLNIFGDLTCKTCGHQATCQNCLSELRH